MALIHKIRCLLFASLLATMPAEKSPAGPPEKAEAKENVYLCRKLPENARHEGTSLRRILSSRKAINFKQSWLVTPERLFAPASAAAAWDGNDLYVYATLQDHDIFNPSMGLNQPAYQRGDIFEIMVRPRNGEAYFEFHITPSNQVLQLRFPRRTSLAGFHESGGKPEDLIATFQIADRVLESHVEIDSERKIWTILVKIPASTLTPGAKLHAGDTLLFSFCRYDHTRGQQNPVLSSTSNHSVCSFHRQEEWRVMQLVDQ